MKKRKGLVSRHMILVFILMAAALAMIVRLFVLQVVNGQKYYDAVHDVIARSEMLQAERGRIFASGGESLAYNEKVYDAVIYYRRKTPAKLNADLLETYLLLSSNGCRIITSLPGYLKFPAAYGEKLATDEAKTAWLKDMARRESDIKKLETAQDIFEYFRRDKFEISDKYSDEEAYRIMCLRYDMLIKGYTQLTPIVISEDIGIDAMAQIEMRRTDLLGLQTEERIVRKYIPSDAFSHITGYIRTIEPQEVSYYTGLGYGLDELVGKEGLEIFYENYLRGINGLKTAVLAPGETELDYAVSLDPIAGFDIHTSVIASVQQTAYDSLEANLLKIRSEKDGITNFGDAKYGAAVMIDVNTGAVLAIASYPGYDSTAFADNDIREVERIMESADKPLLNRALQGLYPPGSVMKPLTAIAALEEGFYAPGELVMDEGVVNYDGMDFYGMEYRKHGISYGNIDLEFALRVSANVFFYKIGVATGIDNLEKWARVFGLGEKTGIDLGGESEGRRNSRETMKQLESDRTWGRADTAQASIGQLYNQFTPLQVARYIAAVANGGRLYTPKLVWGINKRDGSEVVSVEAQYADTGVTAATLAEIRSGMLSVANDTDGSAVDIFDDFPYGKVAGKTGTPETGMEAAGVSSHSVFVCYAPYEKPEVAICVIIENGVWGANSAPVAYDMLMAYFKGKE